MMRLNIKINKILPKLKIKYGISVIILSILLSPVLSLSPKNAFALGIFVPTNDIQLNVTAGLNAGTNATKLSKQILLDTVAYAAANTAIQLISTRLQNFILKNANAFVSDLRADLTKIQNRASKKLGIQINAVQGCFPNLNLAPVPNPVWTPYKFAISISCQNGQVSAMGDFYKSGGFNWNSYRRMASDPSRYNPFGSAVAVDVELAAERRDAKQRELTQLQWGRGIRGLRDSLTGLITKPAAEMQGLADWAFSARLDRTKNTTGLAQIVGTVLAQTTSAFVSKELNGTYLLKALK